MKTVIIQQNNRKKDLRSFAPKLIKKYLIQVMLKRTIHKICKKIKNNYLATKNCRKLKYYEH